MRIVEPTLKMFLAEIEKVEPLRESVTHYAEEYLRCKHDRWKGPQHWETKEYRNSLERNLEQYKTELGRIYDMMHDRGLTNFESGYVMDDVFHPLRPSLWQRLDTEPPEDHVLEQLIEIDPLLVRGLNGAQQTTFEGRDWGPSTIKEELPRPESFRQATTDIQSTGASPASGSGKGKEVSSAGWEAFLEA